MAAAALILPACDNPAGSHPTATQPAAASFESAPCPSPVVAGPGDVSVPESSGVVRVRWGRWVAVTAWVGPRGTARSGATCVVAGVVVTVW